MVHARQAGAGRIIRAAEARRCRLVGSRSAVAKRGGVNSVLGLDDVDALAEHFAPRQQILLIQLRIVLADGEQQ